MRVFYSDHFTLPLPEGHRFPNAKYRMLRDLLLQERILLPEELEESPLATPEELLGAHAPEYVSAVLDGTVSPKILQRIGFAWSEALVLKARASVGGALSAAREALASGISGNLAGGTHHAHADRGEGYCVFNDHAVVWRQLRGEGRIRRAAIIDLDVHQGNGNASILAGDSDVFVFSMHGDKNYPFVKVPSSLDIALADGAGDDEYLEKLRGALPEVLGRSRPELVLYQAGVDPLKEDVLGKLSLSFEGLMERDRLVLEACQARGIPVSMAIGGGYAKPIELSVRAYANTYVVAKSVFEGVLPAVSPDLDLTRPAAPMAPGERIASLPGA